MTTTAPKSTSTASATLGHLALHYRPGDFAATRLLFESLGAHLEENGPEGFFTVVFARDGWNYVDNVMYIAQATKVKLGLEEAITESLRIGTDDEDPRATAFRDTRGASPESLDHVGIRYSSFAELERAVIALEQASATGGALAGRAVVTKYRPPAGMDAAIDDEIAASPIFRDRDDDGTSYVDYGVQVFVKTDLCTTGLFALGQTIELDYFFEPAFDAMPDFTRKKK
jgi:hypothetical protein